MYYYLSSSTYVFFHRTPIHYAAATAQYQCVLSLVANGANLTVIDNFRRTPLHYAAASDADGKYAVCSLHNNHSMFFYIMYMYILSILWEVEKTNLVCFFLSFSCMGHLLRSFTGNTPFTTDSKGFTLLHYAACYGHRMSVQMARDINDLRYDIF